MAKRILNHRFLSTLIHRRPLSTTTTTITADTLQNSTTTVPPPQPPQPPPNPTLKSPLTTQFETSLQTLQPGFTQHDVVQSLLSQPDPDLSFDIFRWTGQQPHFKHTPLTYLTILQITISHKRHHHSQTLVDQILSGACTPSLPLYNTAIKFCCTHKLLFNRAFDFYKKMLRSNNNNNNINNSCKPDLETYKLLLDALLRRFNNVNVCYVYLRGVKSLWKQMRAAGVIPDTFAMNMVIKAHAKCGEVDRAVGVFNEMGLYGNEANLYSYCYLIHGLCEKGRVGEGFEFYKEMRGKGLVPKGSSFMVLICGLAMEGRFEEAVGVVGDMLGESMSPDLLTYKTVVEGLCRDGRVDEAFDVLEEFRKKDSFMNEKTYKVLLNGLHYVN